MRRIALSVLLGLVSLAATAATLRLGPPEVSANQYRFPVYLQGNADGVAALDFRLAYDPAVFSPVSAHSGPSATSAQKQVSSNVSSPGEFVVVMMGFNQNAVAPGEVIQIVLEKIHEPADGQSILRIAEPTMATVDGAEIDSRGLARTVQFGQPKDQEETEDEPSGDEVPTDTGEPEDDPADGPAVRDGALGRVPGGPPYLIAGRAGRSTVPAGSNSGGAVVPGQAAKESSKPALVDGVAQPPGLPEADSASALPPSRGTGPGTGAGPERTGVDDSAVAAGSVEPPGAAGSAGATPALPSDIPEDSGAPRRPVAIFFVFGLASLAGFMVYKVLVR